MVYGNICNPTNLSCQKLRLLINSFSQYGMSFQAIENGLGYGLWLHGEAVAAGTVFPFSSFLNRHSSFLYAMFMLKEVVCQFSGHGC